MSAEAGTSTVDYVLEVHIPDTFGIYAITSPTLPGLFLAGKDLRVLLEDVPLAVRTLRELDRRARYASHP